MFCSLLVVASTILSGQHAYACIASHNNPQIDDSPQINAALQTAGSIASLCPNTNYYLYNSINFKAQSQEISTAGYPTDATRATLVVMGTITRAIAGVGFSFIRIKNIAVNGNRPGLGFVPANPGLALIEIGGISTGQLVEYVHAYEPRSWSTLHIYEGAVGNPNDTSCNGAQILNNQIGPAGQPSDKQWADGISLGCTHSTVEGNVITDATDGGIVVFGAPYSTIAYNTIQSINRVLLGAINMVDWAPYNGNYTGTVVTQNTIYSGPGTGYIKIGIGMGPAVWSAFSPPPGGPNYGGTVTKNVFEGNSFGYATAANGAVDFNISGNTLSGTPLPTFDGLEDPPCTSSNQFPTAFANTGGVTDGICLTPQFNFPTQGSVPNQGFVLTSNLTSAQRIYMGALIFATMQNDGNFVIYGGPGVVVGATGSSANCVYGCIAQFQSDGNFVLYYASTEVNGKPAGYIPYWSTGTAGYPGSQIRISPDPNHPVQIVSRTGVLLFQGLIL
jgi:parallel beta-helix repeat protein